MTYDAKSKHTTAQTTKLEKQIDEIKLASGNILSYMDGYKKGGSNRWFNVSLDDITALIQSEASRIALEAIGSDERNPLPKRKNYVGIRNSLKAEQRIKLKALTAPEAQSLVQQNATLRSGDGA